jgi:hypothetical protein
MRLVTINAPAGMGERVRETAFAAGISKVSINPIMTYTKEGEVRDMESVKVETSTPKAKSFVDALLGADYFDRGSFTFNVRQPRAIVSSEDLRELTTPLEVPPTDLFEELWQFCRITYGLLARVLIAGILIAYGVVNAKMLITIGGLLFLPVLPLIMAIAYGAAGRQWRLLGEGSLALLSTTALLFIAGVLVGLLSDPPPRSDESGTPLLVGIVLSVLVGLAGALASVDDVGRRELIGLAAAGQIGIIPVWFGVIAVMGLPGGVEHAEVWNRAASFFANLISLVVSIFAAQIAMGVVGNIRKIEA